MYLCYSGERKGGKCIPTTNGILFEDAEKAFEWIKEESKDYKWPVDKESLSKINEKIIFACDLEGEDYSKMCACQRVKIGESFGMMHQQI